MNAEVAINGDTGDMQRKGEIRSRKLTRRSWSSSWLAGDRQKYLMVKIQKQKVARTWDPGRESIKGRNTLIWEDDFWLCNMGSEGLTWDLFACWECLLWFKKIGSFFSYFQYQGEKNQEFRGKCIDGIMAKKMRLLKLIGTFLEKKCFFLFSAINYCKFSNFKKVLSVKYLYRIILINSY